MFCFAFFLLCSVFKWLLCYVIRGCLVKCGCCKKVSAQVMEGNNRQSGEVELEINGKQELKSQSQSQRKLLSASSLVSMNETYVEKEMFVDYDFDKNGCNLKQMFDDMNSNLDLNEMSLKDIRELFSDWNVELPRFLLEKDEQLYLSPEVILLKLFAQRVEDEE